MTKIKSVFHYRITLPIVFGALVTVLLLVIANRNVYAALAVISPSNMQSWSFDVQSPDGFGTFVLGPGSPPFGSGSAHLHTGSQGNTSIALQNVSYTGVQLNHITKLEYSSYSQSSGSTSSLYPLLVLNVNTGAAQIGGDTLTFDPHEQTTQSAQTNVWQNWSNAQNGFWRSSNSNFAGGSLSEYVAYVMNFGSADNIVLVASGSQGPGAIRIQSGPTAELDVHDEYIDNFTIGVDGADITFDFEPDAVPSPTPQVTPTPSPSPPPSTPTDKDQCKNGGWNVFRNPTFKNQGDCVSFVNKSNKK